MSEAEARSGARSQAREDAINDAPNPELEGEELVESGRRATNLELFLDLVFVFAVTQVAGVLGADLTPEGVVRGLLLAWLVWWLWSQFAWLGTVVDLDVHPIARFLVLAAVPPTLLIAVALPYAHEDDGGLAFAAAFLVVQWWCLAIQGQAMWSNAVTRRAWLGYAPLAAFAPLVLVVGAVLLDGPARLASWAAVAVFNVVAALSAGRQSGQDGREAQWDIDPGHFAERHSLFVIIALGEVLVAGGAAASDTELSVGVAVGLVTAVSLACVLWWSYFAYVPTVVEQRLRDVSGAERGRVARNLFSFGHLPVVLGVVLYAVVVHEVVGHAGAPLHVELRAVLAGSIALFFIGFMGMQWQIGRTVVPERPLAILAIAVLAAVSGSLPGAATVAIAAVIVAITQAITLRRYLRNIRAEQAPPP